jgi:hypothetical protein
VYLNNLMACCWTGCIGGEVVERCQQWEKQNELSSLLLAPMPAEAVATKRVSVCALTESACAQQALKYDAHLPSSRRHACQILATTT